MANTETTKHISLAEAAVLVGARKGKATADRAYLFYLLRQVPRRFDAKHAPSGGPTGYKWMIDRASFVRYLDSRPQSRSKE
jgi:hypothetical protein